MESNNNNNSNKKSKQASENESYENGLSVAKKYTQSIKNRTKRLTKSSSANPQVF